MRHLKLWNPLLLLLVVGACNTFPSAWSGISDSRMSPLSFQILKEMDRSQSSEESTRLRNEIFSAASIHTALGMAYLGVNPGSKTASELQFFLGIQASVKPKELAGGYREWALDLNGEKNAGDPIIEVANQVIVSERIQAKNGYLSSLKKLGAEVQIANFSMDSARIVQSANQWVSDRTHGKIQEILTHIKPSEQMLVINAIYFKAGWKNKFGVASEVPFYPQTSREDSSFPVQMMSKSEKVRYFENSTQQIVEIPYRGPMSEKSKSARFAMYVQLPKESSLSEFVEKSDWADFEELQKQMSFRQGVIRLPKFRVETQYEMGDILANLGLESLFGPKADFSKISREHLSISRVVHKAFIEVDEVGTEAAAATAIGMRATCVTAPSFEFNANRPFAYLIVDNERNTVLFHGLVRDPRI